MTYLLCYCNKQWPAWFLQDTNMPIKYGRILLFSRRIYEKRIRILKYDVFNTTEYYWSYLHINVRRCGNIYFIFDQVRRLMFVVVNFLVRSCSFGHLDLVK